MAIRHLTVVAGNLSFSFPIRILSYIKSHVQPDQKLLHYSTYIKPEIEQRRFEYVLQQPGPMALIGLCIRPEPAVIAAYRDANRPIVLVDEEAEGASTVATDNYRGAYLAGEYLVKNGRRHIAVICGDTHVQGSYNAIHRLQGVREALAASGLELATTHVIEVTDYSYQDGVRAMNQWLDEQREIDAIFVAAGDDCAGGVLRVAQDRGVNIPGDVAVIGYDDMDSAKFSTPSLSTIRQPLQEMANAAYALASDADNGIARNPEKKYFQPELVLRASA